MLGAGVFAAFGPAARAAGAGLLAGLAVAIAVAYCNATASAQLAAQYPLSGGTYVYGRERLGPWWGFTAGWGFVVGKTASCAAMAITFASYVLPGSTVGQRVVGVAAVVGLTALNYRGITRTAQLTTVLVTVTVLVLVLVVVVIAASGRGDTSRLSDWSGHHHTWYDAGYGVLQSAGLLFFALAGYARIATLGEEVREPGRTIPRAIVTALAGAAVLYAAVAVAVLAGAGPDALAASVAPLRTAVDAVGADWLGPVVRFGAVAASLGALLSLVAGVGRTSLAMARERDLPHWLSAIHPRHHVPHRAEVLVGAVVCGLVATVDLRGVIGFSSFGVLTYYAIANCSAYTQPSEQRRWPRWLNVLGAVGCLVLVVTVPWPSALAGAGVLLLGLAGRALGQRLS